MVIGCDNNSPLIIDEMNFPQQLTSSGYDWDSFWSPNMEYIAFLTLRNTYDPTVAAVRFELWIMNDNGSDQRPLILINDLYEGHITVGSVSWSNNSKDMLVRIGTRRGGSEVWRISVDGKKSRLTSAEDWTGHPKHSPEGHKIAYYVQGPLLPNDSPFYSLYISNCDFSEPVLIDTGLISDFAWKNNSDELIYGLYDWANVNFDLWTFSITGNEKAQFTNTPENEKAPCYSPDDKYIAYSVNDSLYITPSDNFQKIKIFDNGREPRWVPHSNFILFTREQTIDSASFWTENWIIDLEGNIIKKIAEGRHSIVSFSPNGEYFVYTFDGNLWIDKFLQ
jgi:Tol biopolymer transport system component